MEKEQSYNLFPSVIREILNLNRLYIHFFLNRRFVTCKKPITKNPKTEEKLEDVRTPSLVQAGAESRESRCWRYCLLFVIVIISFYIYIIYVYLIL